MKAIVVDDAKAMRMVVNSWLKEFGFAVTEATDGREAWTSLETSGPLDLAIVDWNMPVMTGHELVLKLRANPKFGSMQILMVSSESSDAQMQRAFDAGANAYLAKPISEDELRKKLHGLGFELR